MESDSHDFITALISGACAGLAADVLLFPLDTIKTRLQSGLGFSQVGAFRNIYAGLGPAALASAPGAALFFCTYESVKGGLSAHLTPRQQPFAQMAAAGVGEVTACLLRVPTEVVKQRRQAQQHASSLHVVRATLQREGVCGLYRGYTTTVFREVPFSLLQFPLWEALKQGWVQRKGRPLDAWQAAVCGAVAGGVSAALTTPLDVAKTRVMLADAASPLAGGRVLTALSHVFRERGVPGLFAGVVPRTIWMSTGGFVFLGVYDAAAANITRLTQGR